MEITETGIVLKELLRFLPFLIPVIIIELGFLVFTLVLVIKNEVAYLPKWAWILIIVLINIIGPILFLIIGRKKDTDGRDD
jgi:hypothetical protein